MLGLSQLTAWVLLSLATGISVGLALSLTGVSSIEASAYPMVLISAAGVQSLAGWWLRPTGRRRTREWTS